MIQTELPPAPVARKTLLQKCVSVSLVVTLWLIYAKGKLYGEKKKEGVPIQLEQINRQRVCARHFGPSSSLWINCCLAGGMGRFYFEAFTLENHAPLYQIVEYMN